MNKRFANPKILAAVAATISLYGCGGGGGGGGGTPGSALVRITGTAATGAALASAAVAITNTAGRSPCTATSVTTNALGSYSCTLKSGEVLPFFVVVTDPTGARAPMVSIANSTSADGTTAIANVTPLTTAIVAQSNGGDAQGVVDKKAVPATFNATKANVIAQLKPTAVALDPLLTNYDPFTTGITAATAASSGNSADQMLETIKITKTASGALALATFADPTPVALATATTAGTPVATPTTSLTDLTKATMLIGQAFRTCFALAPDKRVTLDANQNITNIVPECQKITDTGGAQTGLGPFKHNGRDAGYLFNYLLTSSAMTGASFSAPEVIALYPADSSHPRDRVVLNIRFADKDGNADNRITVAERVPNSSTTARPSNWWVTGNQQSYDLSIRTEMRRSQEEFPSQRGTFRNGLSIYINGKNTGSDPAPNSALYDSALVTGDGLPSTGLWFVRNSNSGQFSLTSVRSSAPQTTATLQQSLACGTCNDFRFSRTNGIEGADAQALRANPSSPPNSHRWAKGSDGSYNGDVGTRPTKGSVYVFKIYKNGTLVATESRTLLTDVLPITQAAAEPWNSLGANSASALDAGNATLNGPQASLLVDWNQNPKAERINSIWVSQTNGDNNNGAEIPKGSVVVLATPKTFDGTSTTFTSMLPPLSENTAPFGGYREIGFSYRTFDGSRKQAIYAYYTP